MGSACQDKELEILMKVSKLVNSSLDIDDMLDHVVNAVKQLGYDLCSIHLLNGDHITCRAGYGPDKGPIREEIIIKVGDGITGQVIRTGKHELINNIDQDGRYIEFLKGFRAGSELAVPIIADKAIGVINLEDRRRNAFSDVDVRVAYSLADQLALAIQNARSKQELKSVNKRLQALCETGKLVSASLDLDKVLETILEFIDRQFDYKFSAILLVEKGRLYVRAGRGFRPEVVKNFRPKIGTGIPGNVIKSGRPLNIADVKKDKRYIDVNSATRSELAVPILYEGKAIGAFNIESDKLNNFDDDDVKLLCSLADQAAHAIRNAQLYNEISHFNRELNKRVHEATKDLKEANAELERLNKIKSDFVSTVSHELRTPLTSILGYVSLMCDGDTGPITDEQKEFLGIVREESERLTRLISDLLDISRIEEGRMQLARGDFDLIDFMKGYGKGIRAAAEAKGISIETELPEELPPLAADRDKIKQIVDNLVGNAIKFSKKGTAVRISVKDIGHGVQVEVIDQGIGIDKKDQESIFEKFHQVDSEMTRAVGGTGLGLPITRSLVEAHGGTIDVKSEPGKGSVFRFTLPYET
ncbi:MAG: GAF domain-containing sensor histidine kinase [archaeon]